MANHSRNKHTHTDIQNTTVSFLLLKTERAREREKEGGKERAIYAC